MQRAKFGLLYIFSFFLLPFSFTACATKPSDMRTLVPAETLIYLETNDLAAALKPIVDAKPFKEVAKSQPDLSALKGVQLAVAVLGFEATEEKLTDEQSVGSVKPRFVAVADTHAWNSTAIAFAERKLGGFVAEIYGSEPKLEKGDKHGGKYFAWTAEDKRKAYALVIDGIVYFANDETAIDKCIAVRRGEADSILKTEKIKPSDPGTLARGYVSTDGIAQISGVIGMKLASEASDESEIQSAIAGILPKLIRGTITDINWTMTESERGIQDEYEIRMPPSVSKPLKEVLGARTSVEPRLLSEIPAEVTSATLYRFSSPVDAWRTVRAVCLEQTDPIAAKMISESIALFLEPYGVSVPEPFFESVEPLIITSTTKENGEAPFVASIVKNDKLAESSFIKDLQPDTVVGNTYDKRWISEDDGTTVSIRGGSLIGGDTLAVNRVRATKAEGHLGKSDIGRRLVESSASISSFAFDSEAAKFIVNAMTNEIREDAKSRSFSFTETFFVTTGVNRRTVSDFGLIGQIIAQLADD